MQLEQSTSLESRLKITANELDRLKTSTREKDEQVEAETCRLRDRHSELEKEVIRLLAENAALQRITEERDVLQKTVESSKMNTAAFQQKVDELEQSLRRAGEDREKLMRELQASQTAPQTPHVEVGVNTTPPSSSKPNGGIQVVVSTNPSSSSKFRGTNFSVGRGASIGSRRAPGVITKLEAGLDVTGDALARVPAARMKSIATAPYIIPDLPDNGRTCFSRPFLSLQLGGGSQSLIVQIAIGNEKKIARDYGVTSYLCPNVWENSWCPAEPGMAGYMFVGLGDEARRFVQPEIHHLFVGIARTNYQFMGRYEALRSSR
ncbi:hypothetical protein K503DRAFT_1792 [Rhizopogon vinicolor AM-OR11-026]|uniref:DUF6697 domain-containing protein n=1 Tax=Rhizopogon vinicolor AM-OR11-026 TaxID=1314800 RepID=A0A1B7NIN0_9AGAM|nr:hypothetical protein K503DRAFT_1792 [Rhizopogon vinicolor AM-OR11-026]